VAARIRVARKSELTRHLIRVLLIGVYSGTRSGALLGLKWVPSVSGGWIDLEAGILYRKGIGARATKKRQPPAKLHAKLLPFLRRWYASDRANGITDVVHYRGTRV